MLLLSIMILELHMGRKGKWHVLSGAGQHFRAVLQRDASVKLANVFKPCFTSSNFQIVCISPFLFLCKGKNATLIIDVLCFQNNRPTDLKMPLDTVLMFDINIMTKMCSVLHMLGAT